MDRASMTVRMVGEKLAREARGTAGADAAGKTDRLKAAVQECRTAAAQIQQEAKSKAGASADDLNTLIAEVSSDIEGIIDEGVSSDLIERAQEQLEEPRARRHLRQTSDARTGAPPPAEAQHPPPHRRP